MFHLDQTTDLSTGRGITYMTAINMDATLLLEPYLIIQVSIITIT